MEHITTICLTVHKNRDLVAHVGAAPVNLKHSDGGVTAVARSCIIEPTFPARQTLSTRIVPLHNLRFVGQHFSSLRLLLHTCHHIVYHYLLLDLAANSDHRPPPSVLTFLDPKVIINLQTRLLSLQISGRFSRSSRRFDAFYTSQYVLNIQPRHICPHHSPFRYIFSQPFTRAFETLTRTQSSGRPRTSQCCRIQ